MFAYNKGCQVFLWGNIFTKVCLSIFEWEIIYGTNVFVRIVPVNLDELIIISGHMLDRSNIYMEL